MISSVQQPLHRKGVTKLIEELHELGQVLAKKAAFMDTDDHPDGKGSLKLRLEDEAGDVLAAIAYCSDSLDICFENIDERSEKLYRDLAEIIKEYDSTGLQFFEYTITELCQTLSYLPFGGDILPTLTA
jgi:NTP pyrophosphatase (non-canonical NTP hydrolase)